MESEKVDTRKNTCSSSTKRRAAVASVAGSNRVSAEMMRYFRPRTPPLALTSDRYAFTASSSFSPRKPATPERGASTPTLISESDTPCELGPEIFTESGRLASADAVDLLPPDVAAFAPLAPAAAPAVVPPPAALPLPATPPVAAAPGSVPAAPKSCWSPDGALSPELRCPTAPACWVLVPVTRDPQPVASTDIASRTTT